MKCVQGGVGKGCFGPNNEIVKFYTNFYDAIAHPEIGPNNEMRKALRAWDKAIDQPIGRALDDLRKHPLDLLPGGKRNPLPPIFPNPEKLPDIVEQITDVFRHPLGL